jgi:hypothetical protein
LVHVAAVFDAERFQNLERRWIDVAVDGSEVYARSAAGASATWLRLLE